MIIFPPEKFGAKSTLLTIGPEDAQPPKSEARVRIATSAVALHPTFPIIKKKAAGKTSADWKNIR